jgi:cysteine synthase
MAILEVVENGHGHVTDLRHELGRVRDALDRTDAVLSVTDDALVRAEHAIETSRRVAPVLLVVAGVAAMAVVAAVVWRARQRRTDELV